MLYITTEVNLEYFDVKNSFTLPPTAKREISYNKDRRPSQIEFSSLNRIVSHPWSSQKINKSI